MSEVALNRPPRFYRQIPSQTANDRVNDLFRSAIRSAIASEKKKKHATSAEYNEAVARFFYLALGTGALEATIETVAREFPDEYVARQPRNETALRYVDRVDFRSFVHPAVLSPLIALEVKGSANPCYVGTDKLGHMLQQGYDYLVIYKAVEAEQKGMGELYAKAWGYWSEGEVLPDEYIENYLRSRGMPCGRDDIERTRRNITAFLEDSETIKLASPTPEGVKDITPLRRLAHFIGTHEFGILGTASTGIISDADIVSNEAGFRFFLDLEKDPETLAENFDIADYATCEWDEEVLPSKFLPVVAQRIEEAMEGSRRSYFVHGFGANYDVFKNQFALSAPVIYSAFPNHELRWRIGASAPVENESSEYKNRSQIFAAFDASFRVTGLSFLYFTGAAGASSRVFSDGERRGGFHPSVEAGYELMLLGKVSFQAGYIFHALDLESSIGLGMLWLWR